MNRLVYNFKDGNKNMKSLLGGKGANLAEMVNIGLNVPAGFTITTEACIEYYEKNKEIWTELAEEIKQNLEILEKETGKTFGEGETPLLVSVNQALYFLCPE